MLVNRVTNSYVIATIFEIARGITRDHGVDMTGGEWYILVPSKYQENACDVW